MPGAVEKDTTAGRVTVCNVFAFAVSELDKLSDDERYAMILERRFGKITFRYQKETRP